MFDVDEVISMLESWQKVLEVTIREARNSPDFAAKLAEAFQYDVEQEVPERKIRPAAPDPYSKAQQGEQTLFEWLVQFDSPTLRTIIRSYALDPGKETSGWRDREHLAKFISERVYARYAERQVFLHHSQHQ